jgi:hypothetical protein
MFITHAQFVNTAPYTIWSHSLQWNHGSGLGPGPPPFPLNTTHVFKYMRVDIHYKEHRAESWLVEFAKALCGGEVRGSNPAASNILYIELLSQPVSDTWHPWIGPRVLLLLATQGHVSTPDSPTIDQSASATSPPYGLYGPATSDRTDCTDRYSQHQTFCLFGLTNRSRYLLHTDSV